MRDDAIAWVARMDADDWSTSSESELQAWLAQDPQRHGALLQAQATWAMLISRDAQSASLLDPAAPVDDGGVRPRFGLDRRAVMVGGGTAIAASLAAGIVLGRRTVLRTKLGEIRHVLLEDGSVATLNTGSEVDVVIGPDRRNVRLARGEAWFQVAKDRAKPFLVETGPIRVLAVGTAFSVRRHGGGADVVVTEGVVEVWSEDGAKRRLRLTEGRSIFLADTGPPRDIAVADPSGEHVLAWRSGRIEFINEPLEKAVAEFNRYNHRQIVLLDPRIGQKRIDGFFRTDDIGGFADAVRTTLEVPVDASSADMIRIGSTNI